MKFQMNGIAVLEFGDKTVVASIGNKSQIFELPLFTDKTEVEISPSLSAKVRQFNSTLLLREATSIVISYVTLFNTYRVTLLEDEDSEELARQIMADPDLKNKIDEIVEKFSNEFVEFAKQVDMVIDELPNDGETAKIYEAFTEIDWDKAIVEVLKAIKKALPGVWVLMILEMPELYWLAK